LQKYDKGGLTYATADFYALLVEMERAFRSHLNIKAAFADSILQAQYFLLQDGLFRADLLECIYMGLVSELVKEGCDEYDVGLSREMISDSADRIYVDVVKLHVQVRANAYK